MSHAEMRRRGDWEKLGASPQTPSPQATTKNLRDSATPREENTGEATSDPHCADGTCAPEEK